MTTETGKSWVPDALLSLVMHAALLGVCVWYFGGPISATIIAAGEGQGGGETVIEVGTIDAKTLGFTAPLSVSYVGKEENAANNEEVTTEAPAPDPNAEVLPSTNPDKTPKDRTTDRPTADQTAQLVSETPLRGRSSDTTIDIGRTFGSQFPSVVRGVGVSSGVNLGPNGVDGGSAYGRQIQNILSRNFTPTLNDPGATYYVIIQLRIARDGRILSVVNGRVATSYIKRPSASDIINRDAERAVIVSNPLPPLPPGFLVGVQEAVAEILFKYPK